MRASAANFALAAAHRARPRWRNGCRSPAYIRRERSSRLTSRARRACRSPCFGEAPTKKGAAGFPAAPFPVAEIRAGSEDDIGEDHRIAMDVDEEVGPALHVHEQVAVRKAHLLLRDAQLRQIDLVDAA